MASWTISRFFNDTNKNAPIFAFHSTIYWMRALSLLVNDDRLSDQNISNHYQQISRRKAFPTSWGKLYSKLHIVMKWVTARIKTYGFIVKIRTAPNPPYEI